MQVQILQQSFLDVLEWHRLLFLDSQNKNDWLYFLEGVIVHGLILLTLDFFLRLELREVIQVLPSDMSLGGVDFDLLIFGGSIHNLLGLGAAELFDFVAVQEACDLDEMLFVRGDLLVEELVVR